PSGKGVQKMTHPEVALDDPTVLQTPLRRFMSWLLAAFAMLAVLMTIAQLRTPTLNGMLGTASIYGLLAVLLLARFPLARRPVAVMTAISVGFSALPSPTWCCCRGRSPCSSFCR